MSLQTNWGYILQDVDTFPDMLTVEQFDDFTADKYAGDQRTEGNIKAASMAIRNYCGWHVYPNLTCELNTTLFDGKVQRESSGNLLIQLPAKIVTEVTSILVDGDPCLLYTLLPNGILKVYDAIPPWAKEYTPVIVNYNAGVPDALMGGITELIAHRVTHALASSSGVQSETAGGVSITYSANWINNSRSTALADDNKEVLAPYRFEGVF